LNYSNTLKSLFNLQRRGIKLGLEHTTNLLNEINNPQNNFKCIHIAGTNGKGSVSSLLSSILSLRYKVGLYTSPHLHDYTERIKINKKNIPKKDFVSIYRDV